MGLEPMLVAHGATTTPPSVPADARGRAASPADADAAPAPLGGGEGQVQAARPLLGNLADNSSAINAGGVR